MNLEVMADGASRFAAYVEELTKMIGPADRARSLRDCCAGLLVSEGRRSVEPMAAVTAPAEASVQRHFLANAPWSDEPCWPKYGEMAVSAMERHGPIETWIFEDRSFPKHGSHLDSYFAARPSTRPERLCSTAGHDGVLQT